MKEKHEQPGDARHQAFTTYQQWWEGAALSYLRKRFQPLAGQPAAFERWFDEAARVVLVPSELATSSFEAARIEPLIDALKQLADPETKKRVIGAVGDMPALAELGKEIGIGKDDIPWLTALAATAVAVAAQAQAATCAAECPFCHGLTCFFDGECGKAAGHGGRHKCNLNHTWR